MGRMGESISAGKDQVAKIDADEASNRHDYFVTQGLLTWPASCVCVGTCLIQPSEAVGWNDMVFCTPNLTFLFSKQDNEQL